MTLDAVYLENEFSNIKDCSPFCPLECASSIFYVFSDTNSVDSHFERVNFFLIESNL
jgi:hypothetical protein